jgi:hypothetical protein
LNYNKNISINQVVLQASPRTHVGANLEINSNENDPTLIASHSVREIYRFNNPPGSEKSALNAKFFGYFFLHPLGLVV